MSQNLPDKDDNPAVEDRLDEMVDAYCTAIQREHGVKDSTLDSPYIRNLQREAMRSVLALFDVSAEEIRNAGYYRGRDAGKKIARHQHDKHFDRLLELAAHWRGRAKSAEGKLRILERGGNV